MLSREPTGRSSARNALEGIVAEVVTNGALARVTVDLGDLPLVATVTAGSVSELGTVARYARGGDYKGNGGSPLLRWQSVIVARSTRKASYEPRPARSPPPRLLRPSPMSQRKIAVIAGAGPAGLTAAFELLARTDVHPLVFERTHAIGGIAQTYNYKGNRIDIGGSPLLLEGSARDDLVVLDDAPPGRAGRRHPRARPRHRLRHRGRGATLRAASCRRMTASEREGAPPSRQEWRCARSAASRPIRRRDDEVLLHRPRLSRIYYKRHFFPYPIGITLTVARRLGSAQHRAHRVELHQGAAGAEARTRPTSMPSSSTDSDERLYETFFRDYTEKVWGVPCDEIRADWGAQRVKGLSLQEAPSCTRCKDCCRATSRRRSRSARRASSRASSIPKFGPGQMWETWPARSRGRAARSATAAPCVGVVHRGRSRDARSRSRKRDRRRASASRATTSSRRCR